MTTPPPPRLLTFAPMIDSETMRLLCRWYGVQFVEEDHLFGWASILTLLHGGYGRVPMLYCEGIRLTGPRPLAAHFDPLAAAARRLVPPGIDGSRIEADWDAYNGALATDVAVFAYHHLLARKDLMIPVFASGVPQPEARMTRAAFPLLAMLMKVLLRLTPARARASGERVATTFAAVDRRLEDGRPFLDGDRLTLGDIALAGAAAPLLQPIGYGTRMPEVGELPPAVRELVDALLERRTAAHVQRVYSLVGETGSSPLRVQSDAVRRSFS